MDDLGQKLSMISFAIIGVIALVGVVQGKKLLDMFTTSVGSGKFRFLLDSSFRNADIAWGSS